MDGIFKNGIISSRNGKIIEKLPDPVYYIESSEDDTVLVGMNVEIITDIHNIKTITWFDSVKERTMTAAETRRGIGYFSFKRVDKEGGQTYLFRPMNLDIYNNKVKSHLFQPKSFNSSEEMIEAWKKTMENE